MAKMSDYPSVENTDEFTQEQKEAFLDSAMCIATGSKTQNGAKVTANIPLTDIIPEVPTKLSDLTDDITQQTVVANDTRPVSGAAVSRVVSGGYTRSTIAKTSIDHSSVSVNNRDLLTVNFNANDIGPVTLELANDTEDAVVVFNILTSGGRIDSILTKRDNARLTTIYPNVPNKGYCTYGEVLLTNAHDGSGSPDIPTDFSEVRLGYPWGSDSSCFVDNMLDSATLLAGAKHIVCRIVADFCFVHILPNS